MRQSSRLNKVVLDILIQLSSTSIKSNSTLFRSRVLSGCRLRRRCQSARDDDVSEPVSWLPILCEIISYGVWLYFRFPLAFATWADVTGGRIASTRADLDRSRRAPHRAGGKAEAIGAVGGRDERQFARRLRRAEEEAARPLHVWDRAAAIRSGRGRCAGRIRTLPRSSAR